MAKLILVSGDKRHEFELVPFNSIGRHRDNEIQILDPMISKEHARVILRPDGRYVLRDLGSLNGTYVGRDRVKEHVLAAGDEVVIGSARLLFVDKEEDDPALLHVTIAPEATGSRIQKRIVARTTGEFLPEREIDDEKVLRRDYERLRAGHELGNAIGTELDIGRLVPKILDKAFEVLRADRGVILLLDEKGQLVPRCMKTKHGSPEDIVLSRTVLNEVRSKMHAILSSDAMLDSRFQEAQSIITERIRSTMTVPLVIGDQLLGIMHLDSRIASNAFSEKDLRIFTGIAAQAAVAIQNARFAREIEREAQTRVQLQRLIPPQIVDQVVAGQLQIERGGQLREVTMLYSDIRGFTAMSERRSPQEIVNMLNEYFEVMVDVLFRSEGTLDKFVGDEIIALFGAPLDVEDAAFKAIRCALEMQKELREFNRTRAAEGNEPIEIGIGINTGTVLTGAIGSSKALQFTAIGDAMNVAARLCSAAKTGEIIVSASTMARVAGRVEAVALESISVKGKSEKLQIFNVNGLSSDAIAGDATDSEDRGRG
jgi:adenylate cyclase